MPSGGAKRGAADAVLPSKLTNILAVGGNAVNYRRGPQNWGSFAKPFRALRFCVEPESVEALVAGFARRSCRPNTTRWHVNMPNARSIKRTCYVQFINDIRG
ncbi:hypothetical protein OIU92_00760 [Escherichia coli]|nr:hypothetical protein [Escherichia coli]